ncbi:unnamed protein product [Rangifer tarandus platyrhynchus]|uniref:Uncharacterized protein n=1 Tax=Rangifer tarandus platyrhynchus TaxID=3082113 RepID=A0AC59YP24_RANTA
MLSKVRWGEPAWPFPGRVEAGPCSAPAQTPDPAPPSLPATGSQYVILVITIRAAERQGPQKDHVLSLTPSHKAETLCPRSTCSPP